MIKNKCPKSKKQLMLKLIALAVTLAAVVPFAIAARYSIFQNDDCDFYLGTLTQAGSTYFMRCIQFAAEKYFTWQGTYTASFLNSFLNPLAKYSFGMLRIEMLANIFVLLAAVFALCYEIDRTYGLGDANVYLFAILVLPVLSYREYGEVYLWFVGAMAYTVPLSMLLGGFALLLRARRKETKLGYLGSAILMSLMAGGVLMIGGLGAIVLLFLLAIDMIKDKKIDRGLLAIFVLTVICDLINTLAPGNFVRSDILGTVDVFGSVFASVNTVLEEVKYFAVDTSLGLFIAAAFIIGWRKACKIEWGVFAAALIGFAVIPVVTVFPMLMGYNGNGMDSMSNRGVFIAEATIIFCLEAMAVIIGSQMAAVFGRTKDRAAYSAAIAAAAVIVIFNLVKCGGNYIPVQIAENIAEGKVQRYSQEWHEIYDNMKNSPGEDVVVVWIPDACVGALDVGMVSSPYYPTNVTLAEYFGNNSVCTGYYIYELENK